MPRIFAIGDLHLSLSVENKAMDVFGPGWANHVARLKEGWQDTVGEEDLVLVPGDISWGLRLEEALADLEFIHGLKGTKVLLRGNHDYWWTGYSKVKSVLPSSVKAVQNDALLWNGVIVGGTRGWNTPLSPDFSESKDRKIFEREKLRLGLSLRAMDDMAGRLRVVMLHYPPLYQGYQCPEILSVLEKYPVELCCYGHLHGPTIRRRMEGKRGETEFSLISADYLGFIPKKICD